MRGGEETNESRTKPGAKKIDLAHWGNWKQEGGRVPREIAENKEIHARKIRM